MNFLAHIYLSDYNDDLAVGNFIADSVRGKDYLNFPEPIQNGILLHRAIDTFTDTHPIFRQSTKRLHSRYSHYSGVIVDIYYDHFLAKNWNNYSEIPLENFADHFYKVLLSRHDILPKRIQNLMPYMIADNWLVSYATIDGIASVLSGMNRRTRYKSGMDKAIEELKAHYSEFESEFTLFFEQLREFSAEQLKIVSST